MPTKKQKSVIVVWFKMIKEFKVQFTLITGYGFKSGLGLSCHKIESLFKSTYSCSAVAAPHTSVTFKAIDQCVISWMSFEHSNVMHLIAH